jgi:hypothetical protein
MRERHNESTEGAAKRGSGATGSMLGRRAPRQKTGEGELRAMRSAAWHRQGVIVLRPDDIADDWARQAVINEANRLYGRRAK